MAIPVIAFALAQVAAAQTAEPKPAEAKPTETPAAPAPLPQEHNPRAPGAPSPDAIRMGSPPTLPQETPREGMWPAPTAEDWQRPCLISWQRTFDDALAVAKATGKPILLCVNMDGEIASEHYAGIRYRREDTARLYDPYVCVIASVYRHSPRDYDEEGRRVLCPRFGTVTCGEHIAIEPLLFEKFFDGNRIAPRHIMIELDQKKTYDVYFAWDTKTIFTSLVKGVEGRPPPKPHTDLPLLERVASSDSIDRVAVEVAYQDGTKEVRRALIATAMKHKDVDQVDLLRRAIFGLDLELARLARQALAQCTTESAVDLIAEALKVPMSQTERDALIAAAVRLAEKYPRARTLVAVHQGLAGTSKKIDAQAWANVAARDAEASARAHYEVSSQLEKSVASTEARPDDAGARLELARGFLARAQDPATDRRFTRVMLEDARKSALEAEKLGAKGFDVNAVLAVTASGLGDRAEAQSRAVQAVESGVPAPGGGDGAMDRNAVEVFALFAQARQAAIAKAHREKSTWPPEWLADVHAAYAVLARHPLGTDMHVASHFDFLRWLGATPRATQVLVDGLARFPESWALHERVRAKALAELGPEGLEVTYAGMLDRADASPRIEWFSGYATLVAAEHHRRANAPDRALDAYERAIFHYERFIQRFPGDRESADHYIALALAARARIALERGDLARATDDILASFQKKPSAAASLDGLNISPVDTASMLRQRLEDAKQTDLAARVDAGLAALDPASLELPPYERNVQGAPPGDTRTRRGGRRPR